MANQQPGRRADRRHGSGRVGPLANQSSANLNDLTGVTNIDKGANQPP